MRNKPCVWHFLLRIQLILGSALVLSVPAIAGEMTTAKEPASAARTAPEIKVAQSQKIETAQGVAPTDDPSNLDNSSELDASDDPMGQVTNVSQLQDVQPTDWAYEALRNLVERYGCIAGYPDGTFRGNRAMSRYEFAAGLNACLQQIERLIATSGGTDRVTREDLATLQRLNNEFVTELATLRTRLNNLDTRVTQLEGLQFSTTTRLNGEAIVAAYDAFSGEAPTIEFFNSTFGGIRDPNGRFINIDPKGQREFDSNTALGSRVRLNLDTSFSGRDLLRTGLQVLNSTALSTVTNTPQTDLEFNPGPFRNSSANVELDTLYYRLPLGDRSQAIVAASARLTDIADPVNPYFNSGGLGAVSRFGQFNPIYRLGAGAGVGFKFKLNDAIGVDLGYLGGGRSYTSPMATGNVFGGPYGAIAQLNFTPGTRFRAALTYVHSYNFDPEVGSNLSNPRTTLSNFSRLIDRRSLEGSLSPFLIEQILRFLESNGISRNAFLARQVILRLPLSNDLKNQLLTRQSSAVPTVTVAEILAGAIQQDITDTTNRVVSGLNPIQQQQLVQALQGAGFTNVTAANADQIARTVSQQVVAQGGITPDQETVVRTFFGEQAINELRDNGVTTVTQIQPSQIAENYANTRTLRDVFPDANLPGNLANQTLRTALNNAGYTDRAGNLRFNELLNLRLFSPNQNSPVTISLDGGSAVQLSNGTLGSITLSDILASSNNPTDRSAAARVAEFRQQFPGTIDAINVSRLVNVFNTEPVAPQRVNGLTTEELVRALVNTDVATPLAQDLINLAEQPDFPIVSNSYGLQFSYQVSRGFAIGGWVGYTNNRLLRDIPLTSALQLLDPTIGNLPTRGDTQAINGAINLAFPDLGKRGNLAGIIFGVQPITYQGVLGFDQGPGFHIEGLYRYQVSDNVSVTPGIVWLTRPDHNLDAKDIVVGTIRTTFTF